MANALPTAQQQPPISTTSGQPTTHFVGTGYTLGSDSRPSQAIHTPQTFGPTGNGGIDNRTLTLWRNGFTIEGVPRLFTYDAPENVQMLREMRMGRVPRVIAGITLGENVNMRIEKKETEDYEPPKPSQGGFHGQGVRLGRYNIPPFPTPLSSPLSHVTFTNPSAIPGIPQQPPPPSAPTKPSVPSNDITTPPIDPTQPQTTLQLRLADGTRLVTQFNLSSTMDDVYSFVDRARSTDARDFVLQTIFPTRVLERGGKTVEQEGLKGGTVVMRWKN